MLLLPIGIFVTTLQWRHNEHDGVSNHRRLDCLHTRLFRPRWKQYQISASLAFVRENHRWPVNSPHKGPVMRKMFPFDSEKCRRQYHWKNRKTLLPSWGFKMLRSSWPEQVRARASAVSEKWSRLCITNGSLRSLTWSTGNLVTRCFIVMSREASEPRYACQAVWLIWNLTSCRDSRQISEGNWFEIWQWSEVLSMGVSNFRMIRGV